MSATRDKTQKTTFVYSNFYHLYRKAKGAPKSGAILKVDDLASPTAAVRPFRPTELLGKHLEAQATAEARALLRPAQLSVVAAPAPPQSSTGLTRTVERPLYLNRPQIKRSVPTEQEKASQDAVKSLKENLSTLSDLHHRLRFMLKELEELIRE